MLHIDLSSAQEEIHINVFTSDVTIRPPIPVCDAAIIFNVDCVCCMKIQKTPLVNTLFKKQEIVPKDLSYAFRSAVKLSLSLFTRATPLILSAPFCADELQSMRSC